MIPLPLLAKTRVDLGLIAAWRFEEASSSSTFIDSIGGHSLYDVDQTTTSVAGKIGNAVQMPPAGFTNLELLTPSDDFNFITDPFSIAFWFKRSAGTDTLQVGYQNTGFAWLIQVNETSVQSTLDADGDGWGVSDTVTLSSDTWHFVCMRFDAANVYINVNTRTEVSDTATSCGDQTGGTLTVTPTGTVTIDNMLIADVCWTDAQVALLAGGFQG